MDVFWLQQTESEVPASNDWLSSLEASRLGGMSIPKRRAEWRLGRWTAKCAVAACLKRSAEPRLFRDIEIRPTSSGAPQAFLAGRLAPFSISLSHRAGLAIAAVASSGTALGCDLELIEQRCDSFAADYFTEEEQRLVRSAPTAEQSGLVTLLWSAKESALKAIGQGLRLDTRSMAVKVDMDSISAGSGQAPPAQAMGLPDSWSFPDTKRWHALEIAYIGAQRTLHGWWQRTSPLIRTVVADPPLPPPVLLECFIRGHAQFKLG